MAYDFNAATVRSSVLGGQSYGDVPSQSFGYQPPAYQKATQAGGQFQPLPLVPGQPVTLQAAPTVPGQKFGMDPMFGSTFGLDQLEGIAGVDEQGNPIADRTEAEFDGEESDGDPFADPRMKTAKNVRVTSPYEKAAAVTAKTNPAMEALKRKAAAEEYQVQGAREKLQQDILDLRTQEQTADEALDAMGTPRQRGTLEMLTKRQEPFAKMAKMRVMLAAGPFGYSQDQLAAIQGQGDYADSTSGLTGDVKQAQAFEMMNQQVQQAKELEAKRDALMRQRKALVADADRFEGLPRESQAQAAAALQERQQREAMQKAIADLKQQYTLLGQREVDLRQKMKADTDPNSETALPEEERKARKEAYQTEIGRTQERIEALRKQLLGETAPGKGKPSGKKGPALDALAKEFPDLSQQELEEILKEAMAGSR